MNTRMIGLKDLAILSNLLRNQVSKNSTVCEIAKRCAHFTYNPDTSKPCEGKTVKLNMHQAVNNALDIALGKDPDALFFGEDIGYGGVFKCSQGLQHKYGKERVFNTPICEQGIVGFAIGYALAGYNAITEIQYADYIFPAFDQIHSEAAKMRFRTAGQFECGRMTIRAPCSAARRGGMYHSQNPEAFFAQIPGLKVVIPRGPLKAKGLLLSCIEDKDPCIFFEPKILYKMGIEEVPVEEYKLPIGQAEIVIPGNEITLIGWGSQVHVLINLAEFVKEKYQISCEVIDLCSILPWDKETVLNSAKKTGRVIVAHEAPLTGGFGGEIAASIQEECFSYLKAPIQRVAGFDTPFPWKYEPFYVTNKWRCLDAVIKIMDL